MRSDLDFTSLRTSIWGFTNIFLVDVGVIPNALQTPFTKGSKDKSTVFRHTVATSWTSLIITVFLPATVRAKG